jgi:hypothetical protein
MSTRGTVSCLESKLLWGEVESGGFELEVRVKPVGGKMGLVFACFPTKLIGENF